MAQQNPNTPYGLSPVRRIDGAKWGNSLTVYFVPAAQTNPLFVGDAVTKVAGSADVNGTNGVDLTAAGDAHPITGVVAGFIGVAQPGAGLGQAPSFFGLSATPGPTFRPAATSLDYYVLVNDDPEAEFYIQENDNVGGVPGTPLAVASVGKNANLAYAVGSAFTGWSGSQLEANGVATTSTFQLSIKGFVIAPDNIPAQLHAKVIVTINNHTETPHQAGI